MSGTAAVFQTIIYEKEDGIGYVTLNRPRFLNTYNIEMRDELFVVLSAMRDDHSIDRYPLHIEGLLCRR